MQVLLWGEDPRHQILMKELSKKCLVDKKNDVEFDIEKYDIIVLPMNGVKNEKMINLLQKSKPNVIIYTGAVTNLENINRKIISFLCDEEIREQNDQLTVDGIIDYIKNKRHDKLCILGFGHIGKKLYYQLNNSCDIKVGIILDEDKNTLGDNAFYTKNDDEMIKNLNNCDLIINTVPVNIINTNMAEFLHTPILDIASYPHGIDQNIVKSYNLDYDLYLGIPGKYDPNQAGKILLKKFL